MDQQLGSLRFFSASNRASVAEVGPSGESRSATQLIFGRMGKRTSSDDAHNKLIKARSLHLAFHGAEAGEVDHALRKKQSAVQKDMEPKTKTYFNEATYDG